MKFSDVIGHEELKQMFQQEISEGRLPHALLLCGPEGNGALPLALAAAHQLLHSPMADKFQHPDLHFSFPVFKKDSNNKKPVPCDLFIQQWRQQLTKQPYFGLVEWADTLNSENKQLQMFAEEADSLLKKLSLKANQGGYKVVVMWLPEKMNLTCANKMLKLLEEPPAATVFLLVSEQPEQIGRASYRERV